MRTATFSGLNTGREEDAPRRRDKSRFALGRSRLAVVAAAVAVTAGLMSAPAVSAAEGAAASVSSSEWAFVGELKPGATLADGDAGIISAENLPAARGVNFEQEAYVGNCRSNLEEVHWWYGMHMTTAAGTVCSKNATEIRVTVTFDQKNPFWFGTWKAYQSKTALSRGGPLAAERLNIYCHNHNQHNYQAHSEHRINIRGRVYRASLVIEDFPLKCEV